MTVMMEITKIIGAVALGLALYVITVSLCIGLIEFIRMVAQS